MRALRPVPALLCCSAVALAGCGGSSLLDGNSADELQSSIARVRSAVADGRCDEATKAVKQGLERVDDLPSTVDKDLATRLREGFQELETKIPDDCTETPTTTAPETTTTETTETEPPVDTSTETTETETTETTPPEDTSTETPPDDTETTPPDEGTTPDDGGSSGGTPPADDGVDGPAATPRGIDDRLKDAGRDARKRVERALREARKALRGDR